MARKTIYLIAGARPNFMKIAPIIRALRTHDQFFDYRLVHTGQHYDREMSDVFFEELGIPAPDFHLECGGGSHAEQTARIMVAFEKVCLAADPRPDCVLVVGDVNSTLACAIVAKKLQIPVAHVEAGLRSGDMSMPEEVNRRVTDSITDWFFCTEPAAAENLLREGHDSSRVFHVGHVMIDNLLFQVDQLARTDTGGFESSALKAMVGERYGVVTLHRPSNVDDAESLSRIVKALRTVADEIPLVFPMHPRTRGHLERFGLDLGPRIHASRPLSYMDFLNLWKDARLVMTDSGGLQEETTALGIPCFTLRENTERPITIDEGTNTLVGTSPEQIILHASRALSDGGKVGRRPALWDGNAALRTTQILQDQLA
ncbi:non-hydrolyzing UDP-N-acetylglucosamine 2-epimerase [Uliginosibacterium sp. sgz301328]|uniref:non-hydrolyzing UDP-N-acetylglucosamine 2-epimerase n=1 Tax=Uliginosibacterium sp. sgz301328 TaxID=3243764 RepID=UPI00359E4506